MSETHALQVQTHTQGAVPEDAIDLAVLKVRALLRVAGDPVLFVRVKLAMAADPGVGCPAVAQVSVNLAGRLIRAQGIAETMRPAIDLMCERLELQLGRARRGQPRAEPGGLGPTEEAGWRLPRPREPADARKVVRHKSYGLSMMTVDEAIAELELLDYDFHLFTERSMGSDSVVYQLQDEYRVEQVMPRPDRVGVQSLGLAVNVSDVPAPRLELGQARAMLEQLGGPFLFFVDSQTGRGNLLYHRYDGDYGLITPADE